MYSSFRSLATVALLGALVVCISCDPLEESSIKEQDKLMKEYENIIEKNLKDAKISPADRELLEGFAELNAELESRLPRTDDVTKNLELVTSLVSGNSKMAKAAESLALLSQLHGDTRDPARICCAFSVNILSRNRNLAGAFPNSRVHYLVSQVSNEHVHECQGVYLTRYLELAKLNKDMLAQLMAVLSNHLISTYLLDDSKAVLDMMLATASLNRTSSWGAPLAKKIASGLASATKDNAELDFLAKGAELDQSKFDLAYKRVVMKPCAAFVEEFGPNVFSPAIFDLGVPTQLEVPDTMSSEDVEFFLGLVRFEICEMVQADKDNVFALDVKKAIATELPENSGTQPKTSWAWQKAPQSLIRSCKKIMRNIRELCVNCK